MRPLQRIHYYVTTYHVTLRLNMQLHHAYSWIATLYVQSEITSDVHTLASCIWCLFLYYNLCVAAVLIMSTLLEHYVVNEQTLENLHALVTCIPQVGYEIRYDILPSWARIHYITENVSVTLKSWSLSNFCTICVGHFTLMACACLHALFLFFVFLTSRQ